MNEIEEVDEQTKLRNISSDDDINANWKVATNHHLKKISTRISELAPVQINIQEDS